MNDLAERALDGAVAVRRGIAAHPAASLGTAGFVVAVWVVVTGGMAADARPTRTLSSWLALQNDHQLSGALTGALVLGGLVVLVLLWLVALRTVRRTAMTESRLWCVVAAWTLPFAVGPPLLETTAYSSAAFGFVQRTGRTPSVDPVTALGDVPIVDAVDPAARGTVSAAGPLGSLLQHFAVSVGGGTALGSVIVLRVIGVLAAVAIGRLATQLADGESAASGAIASTALNPLTLLYVVSSPHLDGPMVALVLAALVAVRRRRWLPAVVLSVLAGEVWAQAFVVVPVVVVAHVFSRRQRRLRVLVRDVGAVVVLVAAGGLLLPDGFGWVRAAMSQFSAHPPFSIAYATGRILAPVVTGASFDDLAASGRLTALTAAVLTVAYLLATARHRAPAATTGFALLAMALLAPNLYPWYLLWGVLCLAPTATGERRLVLLALSAAGCALVTPGLGTRPAAVVTGAGLAVVALSAAAAARRRRPATQRPPETSRTAGRTSAR